MRGTRELVRDVRPHHGVAQCFCHRLRHDKERQRLGRHHRHVRAIRTAGELIVDTIDGGQQREHVDETELQHRRRDVKAVANQETVSGLRHVHRVNHCQDTKLGPGSELSCREEPSASAERHRALQGHHGPLQLLHRRREHVADGAVERLGGIEDHLLRDAGHRRCATVVHVPRSAVRGVDVACDQGHGRHMQQHRV